MPPRSISPPETSSWEFTTIEPPNVSPRNKCHEAVLQPLPPSTLPKASSTAGSWPPPEGSQQQPTAPKLVPKSAPFYGWYIINIYIYIYILYTYYIYIYIYIYTNHPQSWRVYDGLALGHPRAHKPRFAASPKSVCRWPARPPRCISRAPRPSERFSGWVLFNP